MSDPTAQEPTMEEILASIRRIISEDDAPAAEPPAAAEAHEEHPAHEEPIPVAEPAPPPIHLAAVAPSPAPVHEAEPEEEEEDVLELTEPAPADTLGDLEVFDVAPPKEPEPVKAEAPAEKPLYKPSFSGAGMEEEPLISGGSEDKAASHFGKLSQSIAMPAAGRNLEDVVAELLKPLLKDWLDQNLPAIVEEKVQAEVERISRRRI